MKVKFAVWALLGFAVSVAGADDAPVCSEVEREAYLHSIEEAVVAAWNIPYEYKSLSCTVLIKQNFRGEVLNVGIAKCGDDPVVHKSVVDAGYEASPVPRPGNKACFTRDIILKIESRVQDSANR